MNFSPCEYGEKNGEYGRLECAEGMELVVVKLLPALRVPEEKELKKENKLTLILYITLHMFKQIIYMAFNNELGTCICSEIYGVKTNNQLNL